MQQHYTQLDCEDTILNLWHSEKVIKEGGNFQLIKSQIKNKPLQDEEVISVNDEGQLMEMHILQSHMIPVLLWSSQFCKLNFENIKWWAEL
jgi:hypothetical protein